MRPRRVAGTPRCCGPVMPLPGGHVVLRGACTRHQSARTSTWKTLPQHQIPSPLSSFLPSFRVRQLPCVQRVGAHVQLCEPGQRLLPWEHLLFHVVVGERMTCAALKEVRRLESENETYNLLRLRELKARRNESK